jgi:hypothetical protein
MSLFGNAVTQALAATTPAQATKALQQGWLAQGLGGDDVLAASQALVPLFPVNVPGMVRPYRAHQAAAHVAANADIARWGAALLGDDMGMGKTQVLAGLISERLDEATANGVAKPYAVVVIPPVALAGYQQDFAAAFPHLRIVHLKGRKVYTLPAADVYLINDDSQTMAAWLTYTTVEHRGGRDVKVAHGNDFVKRSVLFGRDEIHRDKGNQGKPTGRARTMLAVGEALRVAGKPIVGMTGTLLTNRPVEAFLPLQILGGEALVTAVTPGARKASGFLFRYCAPQSNRFGTSFGGVDIEECERLHDYLRRTVYVRREKADLGEALPHSGWIIKPIALNGVLTRYERIERDFLNLVMQEEGPEAMWRKGRAEAITRMQAMWEEAGVAKVPAAVEYVQDLVDQGRKVVVFYYHQRTWDKLALGFAKAGIETTTINGAVTGDARTMAVDDFQNGTAQVLLAQIRAAGMAVTLTAAADAVFVQVPWSAGDLKQAADRILRVDDRTMARAIAGESITWHVLQAAHDDGTATFDMAMWSILEGKAKVCDAVNAGRPVTMSDESIMQQALEAWYPQARSRY